MNVLSLFDGISCGQIALERVGIKVDQYFASEIDKNAIKVTQKNYPNTKQLGSVVDISADDLPNIDLLIGGSPCQGFSFSGQQLNFNDERSKLFFEYVRLLKETKPKYYLLENVVMKREYQDIISDYLGVKPIKINSALVSAQSRNRLYWTNIPHVKQPEDKGILLKDIAEKPIEYRTLNDDYIRGKVRQLLGDSKYLNSFKFKWDKERRILVTRPDGLKIQRIGRIAFDDNKAEIITVSTQPTVAYRKVTTLEAARLQTVSDHYFDGLELSDSAIYKQLGNGWTVDVIAHILGHINEKI